MISDCNLEKGLGNVVVGLGSRGFRLCARGLAFGVAGLPVGFVLTGFTPKNLGEGKHFFGSGYTPLKLTKPYTLNPES